jgi:hypothetical protein
MKIEIKTVRNMVFNGDKCDEYCEFLNMEWFKCDYAERDLITDEDGTGFYRNHACLRREKPEGEKR